MPAQPITAADLSTNSRPSLKPLSEVTLGARRKQCNAYYKRSLLYSCLLAS